MTIRSGEHEGFSRLVLSIPDGAAWSLDAAPGGFELALPAGLGFETAGVFDRIPRDRIADLLPRGEGRLGLAVACDCHAEAFAFGPGRVVIDVRDGPPPPGGLAPGAPAPPVIVLDPPPEASAPPAAAPPGPEAAARAEEVALAEAAILEGFARAASQGLIDVAPTPEAPREPLGEGSAEPAHHEPEAHMGAARSPDPHDGGADGEPEVEATEGASAGDEAPAAHGADVATPDGDPDPPQVVPRDPPAPAGHGPVAGHAGASEPSYVPDAAPGHAVGPDPAAELAALARPGVTLRTSAEADARAAPPLAAEGDACLPDASLDLAAWAGSGDFSAEVAAATARLTTERDLIADGAVEALARTYLAFGFGREAAWALRLDGRASAGRDHLLVLAALVDGAAAPADAFAGQGGCVGAVALWRALARGTLGGTDAAERTGAETALRALPDALRGHLALRLAGIFLDAGDPATARALADLARGTNAGAGAEAGLAAAEILEGSDEPARARETLAALVEEEARLSPDAAIRLIDLTVEAGRPVDEATLDLARSLRFEARDRPEGLQLRLAEGRALVAAARFPEALGLLAGQAGAEAAFEDATVAAAERMEDAPFAELALGGLPAPLPALGANAVARRLLALGFAPEAAALLAPGAEGGAMGERRYLRAEAAVAMGDAAGARTALLGLNDERARALRATADALGGRDPAEDPLGSGASVRIAPIAQEAATGDRAGAPTLAGGRALLEQAGAARAGAQALLAAGP